MNSWKLSETPNTASGFTVDKGENGKFDHSEHIIIIGTQERFSRYVRSWTLDFIYNIIGSDY